VKKFMIVLKTQDGNLQIRCESVSIEFAIQELQEQYIEEWVNKQAFIVENIPVHLVVA